MKAPRDLFLFTSPLPPPGQGQDGAGVPGLTKGHPVSLRPWSLSAQISSGWAAQAMLFLSREALNCQARSVLT